MAKIPYLFIASSPFSGSTLLSFLLGAHPEIASISAVAGSVRETMMDTFECSCGKRLLACEFWLEIQQRMHQRGFHDFDLANFKLTFRRPNSRYDRLSMSAGLPIQGEAIRDGIFRLVPGHEKRNRAKDGTIDVAASRWVKENRSILRNLECIASEKQITINFEQKCLDVSGTMRKLFEFCEVDADYVVDDFRTVPQHILGNPMRMRTSSEIKLDEGWRQKLSEADLERINHIAQPMMSLFA